MRSIPRLSLTYPDRQSEGPPKTVIWHTKVAPTQSFICARTSEVNTCAAFSEHTGILAGLDYMFSVDVESTQLISAAELVAPESSSHQNQPITLVAKVSLPVCTIKSIKIVPPASSGLGGPSR